MRLRRQQSLLQRPPLLEALSAGAVDIGGVGDSPPIFAQAAGAQLAIVAVLRLSPKYEALLVPKDSSVREIAGLKGKKIAVAKGSGAHHLLLAALERAGLSMTDIQPVYLAPTDAQPAFASGDVDAWAVWDPSAVDAVLHGSRRLLDGEGLIPGLNFQVASPAALADPARARLLGDYLARAQRAQKYANAHREAWANRYAELTKLAPEVTRAMFAYYAPVYVSITPSVIAEQQRLADTFYRAKLIGRALEVAPIFDARFDALLHAR